MKEYSFDGMYAGVDYHHQVEPLTTMANLNPVQQPIEDQQTNFQECVKKSYTLANTGTRFNDSTWGRYLEEREWMSSCSFRREGEDVPRGTTGNNIYDFETPHYHLISLIRDGIDMAVEAVEGLPPTFKQPMHTSIHIVNVDGSVDEECAPLTMTLKARCYSLGAPRSVELRHEYHLRQGWQAKEYQQRVSYRLNKPQECGRRFMPIYKRDEGGWHTMFTAHVEYVKQSSKPGAAGVDHSAGAAHHKPGKAAAAAAAAASKTHKNSRGRTNGGRFASTHSAGGGGGGGGPGSACNTLAAAAAGVVGRRRTREEEVMLMSMFGQAGSGSACFDTETCTETGDSHAAVGGGGVGDDEGQTSAWQAGGGGGGGHDHHHDAHMTAGGGGDHDHDHHGSAHTGHAVAAAAEVKVPVIKQRWFMTTEQLEEIHEHLFAGCDVEEEISGHELLELLLTSVGICQGKVGEVEVGKPMYGRSFIEHYKRRIGGTGGNAAGGGRSAAAAGSQAASDADTEGDDAHHLHHNTQHSHGHARHSSGVTTGNNSNQYGGVVYSTGHVQGGRSAAKRARLANCSNAGADPSLTAAHDQLDAQRHPSAVNHAQQQGMSSGSLLGASGKVHPSAMYQDMGYAASPLHPSSGIQGHNSNLGYPYHAAGIASVGGSRAATPTGSLGSHAAAAAPTSRFGSEPPSSVDQGPGSGVAAPTRPVGSSRRKKGGGTARLYLPPLPDACGGGGGSQGSDPVAAAAHGVASGNTNATSLAQSAGAVRASS